MKVVLLYSGGLDSTVLLYHLRDQGHQVVCLSFDYGSKHARKELAAAEEICKGLDIPRETIKLDFINQLVQNPCNTKLFTMDYF